MEDNSIIKIGSIVCIIDSTGLFIKRIGIVVEISLLGTYVSVNIANFYTSYRKKDLRRIYYNNR